MMSTEQGRVDRAVEAALAIAADHGVVDVRSRVLQHSNNVVVHLAPAPVVAKVRTSPRGAASIAGELAVGEFLAERDAPSVAPARILPSGPHSAGGLAVGYWEHCPHDAEAKLDGDAVGRSLAALHDALDGYPDELPSFIAKIEDASAVLAEESLPALGAGDRAFLAGLHEHLSARLADRPWSARPLHGDVHLGNLLATAEGPRWVDLEAACLGPREWDLAGLPDEALDVLERVDSSLLALLRDLRSVCVAAWCSRNPQRDPGLREAIEFQIGRLRSRHS